MLYSHDDLRWLAGKLTGQDGSTVAELEQDGSTVAELEQAALGLNLLLNTVEVMRDVLARHDARVTELLEANNREVERRREAEAAIREAQAQTASLLRRYAETEQRLKNMEDAGKVTKFEPAPLPFLTDCACSGGAELGCRNLGCPRRMRSRWGEIVSRGNMNAATNLEDGVASMAVAQPTRAYGAIKVEEGRVVVGRAHVPEGDTSPVEVP